MTLAADTRFTAAECVRCGDVVIAGRMGGLGWRVERRSVPVRHARVLKTYGVIVLVLDLRVSGVWADFWTLDHDMTTPHRYLACPHVCGSAHSQGRTFL